jgi:hypothetical protein
LPLIIELTLFFCYAPRGETAPLVNVVGSNAAVYTGSEVGGDRFWGWRPRLPVHDHVSTRSKERTEERVTSVFVQLRVSRLHHVAVFLDHCTPILPR